MKKMFALLSLLVATQNAVAASDPCIKEVYLAERNRGVDHDQALKNAQEVCNK